MQNLITRLKKEYELCLRDAFNFRLASMMKDPWYNVSTLRELACIDIARAKELKKAISILEKASEPKPIYSHKEKGGIYGLLETGEGVIRVSSKNGWIPSTFYRGKDGRLYAQPVEDFDNKMLRIK